MGKLKVGHIPYLNCVPFFHYLKSQGFAGELVSGVPSELNRMLQHGRVDVSPSSSFEYARNWKDYLLLPGHSISSIGKVYSVLLFSPVSMPELEGANIAITGESATSINLLRIILHEFIGLQNVTDAVPDRPVEELIATGKPALLIGDRALRLAAQRPAGTKCYDLGELWLQYTGLPFVFALWMIRRDSLAAHSSALERLAGQLHLSMERVLTEAEQIAAQEANRSGLSAAQVAAYWRSIDYRLEQAHLDGLQLFFELCVKLNLLEQLPEINFLPQQVAATAD